MMWWCISSADFDICYGPLDIKLLDVDSWLVSYNDDDDDDDAE